MTYILKRMHIKKVWYILEDSQLIKLRTYIEAELETRIKMKLETRIKMKLETRIKVELETRIKSSLNFLILRGFYYAPYLSNVHHVQAHKSFFH